MIKSTKYIIAFTILLIGNQLLDAKENVGVKKSTAPANNIQAKMLAGCPATTAQIDLSINNVRARILNGGDLWWNYNDNSTGIYEVPSGSGKNSIYAGALWIAGYDAAGNLKAAAQTYRQSGANDFWSGPIAKNTSNNTISVTTDVCSAYDRFWILNKSDVESFVASGNGGTSAEAISTWPGNGNVGNGELPYLAPFFDANNNGIYEPANGDYPHYLLEGDYVVDSCSGQPVCNDYLFGDRTIWWVFNDVGGIHTETNSANPIGLEIRAQAFAFSTTDQINSMTFYKYQVINRNPEALLNTYFGQWCDADLGNAADDQVGCDVGLGLGFTYNGDANDEGAGGYGANPPAVGIDFFQGPYGDYNDGKDNDRDGCIDGFDTVSATGVHGCCPETPLHREQIIMSKFMYYTNTNGVPTGNPGPTDDYYQYLSGTWLDGVPLTYGGDGRGQGGGATNSPCDFMFPGTTDPAHPTNWTMTTGGIQPTDMRFLESAGTFSLDPGAVNYVTTGVVWAQSIGGGPQASVELMKIADQKAQALFDACFKVLAGPDAPNIAIRELDKQLIVTLVNTENGKVEGYNQIDPTIPKKIPTDTNPAFFVNLSKDERSFKFEGYKIYQLADETVKSSDLADETKAKLIGAYDVNNGVGMIINYRFDSFLKRWVPEQKTDTLPQNINVDKGITHSFLVTTDLFTSRPLVNYKAYYFMAVSYAYNNYRSFDYNNTFFTQSAPFVLGGKNTKAYSGIPHKNIVDNLGTVLHSNYLDNIGAGIKRIEGKGNGGNVLEFASGVEDEILNSPDNRSATPVYQAGKGPIRFAVVDPVKIKSGDFSFNFDGLDSVSNLHVKTQPSNFEIAHTIAGIKVKRDFYIDSMGYTVYANLLNIADSAYQVKNGLDPTYNNGYLESSITFAGDKWLTGVKDNDKVAAFDWIKSGSAATDFKGDPNSTFESIISGTWAPFALIDDKSATGTTQKWSVKPNVGGNYLKPFANETGGNSLKFDYLNSVDLVITSDKSKWTRCIVFETGNGPPSSASRFVLRNHKSIGKGDPNDTISSDATLSSPNGMSWFPGYAINIETGERLNMAFGENSGDAANNGTDMLWNPTRIDTGSVYGGRHYVYIFNHIVDTLNGPGGIKNFVNVPKYDYGKSLVDSMKSAANLKFFMRSCIWAGIPLLDSGHTLLASDVRIRFRVAKTYENFVSANPSSIINNGNPYYEYSIPGTVQASINQKEKATSALDMISAVPNPYYAYASYERTIRDQLDNRIRFINLPSKCKIRIYNLSGTLIRTLTRSVAADVSEGYTVEANTEDKNLSSTLDWDLNNSAGIKVSSGVYIIHIDAGELGEKIIKWFGIMRPIDLDTF